MKEFNFKISDYSIHLGERIESSAAGAGKKKTAVTVTAILTCRGEAGERIIVNFYRPAAGPAPVIPSTCHIGEEGKAIGIIWEDVANYKAFIDLVRNESPIWGYIESGRKGTDVRLYTGRWEPVGPGDEDYRSDPTR